MTDSKWPIRNDQLFMDQYLIKIESYFQPSGLELDRIHDNKFLKQTSCHIRDKRQRTASGHEFMQWTELR